MLKIIFNYLIFPGFLFSTCAGLIAGWVDRKVSARLQWRVGPPFWQNFWDIIKLCGKETIVPEGAKATFLLAPCLGFLSLVLVAAMLGRSIISFSNGFPADLIVILYLLIIPAAALIIGASSSRNPLASVGASREMKMVLAYELPFILSVIAVIIKSQGAIRIGDILNYQAMMRSNLFSASGLLAFAVIILCMQAKLCLAPFDASEAEQEIMGGVLIEYSGLPLALLKLSKALMLYIMPLLAIILFLGKDLTPLFLVGKYIMLLVIIILIKNTNPRARIDQAVRFFWRIPVLLAIASIVLAIFGL